MARLVIIVTFEGDDPYILWQKVGSWCKSIVGSIDIRYRKFNDDLAVVFCHPRASESEQRKKATKMTKEVIEQHRNFDEVYIAAHRGRVDWKDVGGELKSRLKGVADFDHWGEHQGKDSVYDAILNLVNSPSNETFNAAVEEIKKKHPLTLVRRLSILKHRIAHLFLPLDIDLQGLREVTNPQKRREYAEEIINDYRNRCADYPFLQLLADLHFLVSKANEITLDTGVTVGKSLSDESLPDGKCVKEVLEEAGVAFPSDLKQICAFKNDWSFDPDAEIAKFLCALDKAVKKGLQCDFLKIVDSGVNGFNGQCFHQWFAQLIRALDELRDAIERAQERSEGSSEGSPDAPPRQ